MPRGDRTGPMGAGPQTGRAAGFCSGYDVPGFMNLGFGRGGGFGRGRGGGRGMAFRRGWNQGGGWGRGWSGQTVMPPNVQVENRPDEHPTLQTLLEKVSQLQAELSEIQEAINKLEST